MVRYGTGEYFAYLPVRESAPYGMTSAAFGLLRVLLSTLVRFWRYKVGEFTYRLATMGTSHAHLNLVREMGPECRCAVRNATATRVGSVRATDGV